MVWLYPDQPHKLTVSLWSSQRISYDTVGRIPSSLNGPQLPELSYLS